MNFNDEKLTAIVKLAIVMSEADGKVQQEEVQLITHEMRKFAVTQTKASEIMQSALKMNSGDAILIIKAMTNAEKKYVCGFLGAVMAADRNIDDKEIAVWRVVSAIANFPDTTLGEAVMFWNEN